MGVDIISTVLPLASHHPTPKCFPFFGLINLSLLVPKRSFVPLRNKLGPNADLRHNDDIIPKD